VAAPGLGDPGARWVHVAVDGKGRGLAAWQIATGARLRVVGAEELTPGAWTVREPAAAFGGKGDSFEPDLAVAGDGAAVIAWEQQDGRGARGVVTSVRDGEGRWTDPGLPLAPLSFPPHGTEARVAGNAGGDFLVAWDQPHADPTDFFIGVQIAELRAPSGSWTRPQDVIDVLSPRARFTNKPRLVLNDAGDALVTWYQAAAGRGGGALMVFVSERFGSGGELSRPDASAFFSAPGAPVNELCPSNPEPALGFAGEGAVVWTQENGAGASPVYLATRDGHHAWTKPATLADAFSPVGGPAACAKLAFGARGDLHVVWLQDPGGGNVLYAAHRAADESWLDAGRSPVALSTPGWTPRAPAIAAGKGGTLVVVWTEHLRNASRVVARRSASGDRAWGPIEVLSPEAAGNVEAPSAAIGGPRDRVLVGWVAGTLKTGRAELASLD
jgi:hypothetical protein